MGRGLKIVMVSQPVEGGAWEHVMGLARGLGARGHSVTVLAPTELPSPFAGVDIEALPMGRSVSPAPDSRAVAELARAVRRLAPDIIHAHSSKAGALARVARVARPRTPVVYTPHGYAFAGYFESEGERSLYRAAERALAPLASRVLCVCEAERGLAATVGPVRRTRVVHNGVQLGENGVADPELASLRRRGPVIGVLSGLRPGKGLETAIDAMAEVARRHPTATLAVAGEGSERPALQRRIVDLGLEDAVRLIGETPGPLPLLRGCDVFCSPSWAESLPLSLLEAMWLHLPIVSTDVGGCSEAIADGESGVLVPPREADALAGALCRVLGDQALAARLGESAGRRARREFTADRMVEGTLTIYRELAD